MGVSHTSLVESAQNVLPITAEVCPWCEQPVPHEKFEEFSSRFQARENERIAEVTARLCDQAARENAETEDRLNAEIEQVRRNANVTVEALRAEFAANVDAARTEARKEAES